MKPTMTTLLLVLLAGGLLLTACGKDEPADTADGQAGTQTRDEEAKSQAEQQKSTAKAEKTLADIQDKALGGDKPAPKPKPEEKPQTDAAKAAEDLKKTAGEEAQKAAEDAKEQATDKAKDAADSAGAVKSPWHDAKVGTRLKYRNVGGTFMVYEVVKADPDTVTVKMTPLNAENEPLGEPIEQVYQRMVKPDSKEAEKHKKYLSNKKGMETVQVAGKSYECDVYETTSTFGGKTIKTRMYMCEDIPGWMVKTESDLSGDMQTQQELIDIKQ